MTFESCESYLYGGQCVASCAANYTGHPLAVCELTGSWAYVGCEGVCSSEVEVAVEGSCATRPCHTSMRALCRSNATRPCATHVSHSSVSHPLSHAAIRRSLPLCCTLPAPFCAALPSSCATPDATALPHDGLEYHVRAMTFGKVELLQASVKEPRTMKLQNRFFCLNPESEEPRSEQNCCSLGAGLLGS